MQEEGRRPAMSGLVAAAVALGAGELVAGAYRAARSPVEAVAAAVIDLAPTSVTRFGISLFGTNDKLALVVGVLVVLALLAPAVGVGAARRPWVGAAAFAVLGAAGVAAALRDGGGAAAAVPAIVAGAGGLACLRFLLRTGVPRQEPEATSLLAGGGANRRSFLTVAGALTVAAAAGGVTGRGLRSRFAAGRSRAELVLPEADSPLPPVPAGVEVGVAGVAPFVTPNADFYRIDTALLVPQVAVEGWTLRVSGMVDRPLELTFDELCERGLVEADITLTCVSNPVGGRLVGHARWLGVPLATLLDEAGVDPAADQIVGRSVDGYTGGFPVAAAYDRNALVAVGMNGEALPLEHGFPARLITPGLYGYVSATKWLREIELTTFDAFDQYWVPRGYAAEAPIKTMARIDVPRSGAPVAAGPAVLAGVAWSQTRGIAKVEVRIDDGPWQVATLADELNVDSWRQWRLDWTAEPGAHRAVVRATDGDGRLQIQERAEIYPDGASGWVSQLITVTSGS